MKIAFLHTPNFFTSELLKRFRAALSQHEVVEWIGGKDAPVFDFEVLLAMGYVGRELLQGQPKLKLIQTASDGYEEVDTDAASELGIWVSYAPADLTGNATSVAEFAVLLLLGAARHVGEALASLQKGPVKPPTLNLSLSGKTVCIVGLGTIGQQLAERLRPFGVKMVATDEVLEVGAVGAQSGGGLGGMNVGSGLFDQFFEAGSPRGQGKRRWLHGENSR